MAALFLLFTSATPNPYLDEARALVKGLDFADAITQLKVAREVPGQSAAQLAEVQWLLGHCLVAEGRRGEAEVEFLGLLEVMPSYAPERSGSPKILEVFDAVKARRYAKDFVKLEPRPSTPGTLEVKLVDPWRKVSAVVSRQKLASAASWDELVLEVVDGVVVAPLTVPAGERLEHYLEARDASGATLAQVGRPEAPLTLEGVALERPPDGGEVEVASRWSRAPGWVLMGAAVVAAGVGVGLQASSMGRIERLRDTSQPPGDFADTARAEHGVATGEAQAALGCFIGAGLAGVAGVVVFAW